MSVFQKKRICVLIGLSLFLLFFSLPFSSFAAERLPSFPKDSSPRVAPNVLMLIDNSGSMARSDLLLDQGDVATYGDGTPQYMHNSTKYNYFGIDVFSGNNDASVAADGDVNFNYHPRLVYIPATVISAIEAEIQTKVNAGWPNITLDSRFAQFVSGDITPNQLAEKHGLPEGYYSKYKYPNDSRMYILKNVMWRLLHDEAIFGGLRLAFSAYHHDYSSEPVLSSGNYRDYVATEIDTGYWEWRGLRRVWVPVIQKVWRWESVRLHWDYRNVQNRGMLLEPFRLATDDRDYTDEHTNAYGRHIDNLREWFSGINTEGAPLPGTEFFGKTNAVVREFRSDTWTPLARSIFNDSSGSSLQFFNATGVISDYCQQNWLIILTDGEDQFAGGVKNNVPDAVKKLRVANVGSNSENQKVKTFVIGFVNSKKAGQQSLVDILNSAAQEGGTEKAYFAADMQQLFGVLRQIFNEIQEASNRTGGAPMIAPPSGPEEKSVLYLPSHDPLHDRQWRGYLRKLVRKTSEESGASYLEEIWEASKQLDLKSWNDRAVFTSYQGLTGSVNNLVPFSVSEKERLYPILGLEDQQQAENFIKWVLGKDVYEEEIEKEEIHKLIDINHSGLLKIGAPSGGVLGEEYAGFRKTHNNRKPLVYVQSNAGMLHAFDDETGEEEFAFIPPNILSGGRLTGLKVNDGLYSENEISFPRYLLNGPLVAEDVLIGTNYKTLLMGLSGPGGPGFYTMDVTNPASPLMLWAIENSIYDSSGNIPFLKESVDRNVLRWRESLGLTNHQSFSHADLNGSAFDYRLLRQTISKPFIGRVFLGTTPSWKWVFLMGSGIASGVAGDVSPAGALFVGNMEDGSIVKSFPTSTPVTSSIATVFDRYKAYAEIGEFLAGDYSGVVYKGDISDRDASNWKWHRVLEFPTEAPKKNGGVFRGLNAFYLNKELWLLAGTGEGLDFLGKPVEDNTNYFAAAKISNINVGDSPITITSLAKLNVSNGSDDGNYEENMNRIGWFLEFEFRENTSDRETMITPPLLYRNKYVFFFTFIPDTSDVCVEDGASRLYILHLRRGTAPESWDKKYKEFKGIKVTGIALIGDNLAVSTSVLRPSPGAGEDLDLREQIVDGEIEDLHLNTGVGLFGENWDIGISPSFWRVR